MCVFKDDNGDFIRKIMLSRKIFENIQKSFSVGNLLNISNLISYVSVCGVSEKGTSTEQT